MLQDMFVAQMTVMRFLPGLPPIWISMC